MQDPSGIKLLVSFFNANKVHVNPAGWIMSYTSTMNIKMLKKRVV